MADGMLEKRANANLNTWLRSPGIIVATVLLYQVFFCIFILIRASIHPSAYPPCSHPPPTPSVHSYTPTSPLPYFHLQECTLRASPLSHPLSHPHSRPHPHPHLCPPPPLPFAPPPAPQFAQPPPPPFAPPPASASSLRPIRPLPAHPPFHPPCAPMLSPPANPPYSLLHSYSPLPYSHSHPYPHSLYRRSSPGCTACPSGLRSCSCCSHPTTRCTMENR